MENYYLRVPIRIEAKYIKSERMVSSPLADFTNLPWNDGKEDINFDQPFVSDGIIHQPFESQNLLLEKGVHLHFIIPHYLGQHIPQNAALRDKKTDHLPAAPNTWLITKKDKHGVTQWIIESDYIHDETYTPPANSEQPPCIIPYMNNQNYSGKPYRYMGRKTLLSDTRKPGDTFKSLNKDGKPLTVIGYGDINFSSFYPNCASVFGFHEKIDMPSTLSYSVLGWNSEVDDDLLNNVIKEIFKKVPDASNDQINMQLKNLFKLEIKPGENKITSSSVPRAVFYGEINIDNVNTDSTPDLKISIGNTGSEALSALMAEELGQDSSAKKIIEEQLESILLFSKLDHLATDIGPKFLEARHEKGFRSSHSGHLWKIVTQSGSNTNEDSSLSLPELPTELAKLLHQLNLAQFNFDKNFHEITSLKEQLYLDWYKYMHAAYPPIEGRGEYPDPDHIRYFIQNYSLQELKDKINATGKISYKKIDKIIKPVPQPTLSNDLAHKLLDAWIAVTVLLNTENSKRKTNKQPLLEIAIIAGPRYWEPNAPAVMIADKNSKDIEHAEAKNLTCSLLSSGQSLTPPSISTQNTGDILTKCSGTNTYKLSDQTWNPFILDWEIDLTDTNMSQDDGAFDNNGINNNFILNQHGPDFIKKNYSSGSLSVFAGSVIMSTHARPALLLNIKSFITNTLKQENIKFTGSYTINNFLEATDWAAALNLLSIPDSILNKISKKDFSTNPFYTAWKAYKSPLLARKVISQTLSGFNQASIMRRKAAQLPVAEPLGFEVAQKFTADVKKLADNKRDSSPITAFDFNPLRSGKMKLNMLRLVDNFGEPHDINTETISVAASETLLDSNGNVFLKPRLAQSARLNFRWLSATGNVSGSDNYYRDGVNQAETNDHPATSPICGWLTPNYLDNSMAVFAADGTALGYINSNAEWNSLPWLNQAASISKNIQNPYLQNVVNWLVNTFKKSTDTNSPKWNDFITTTEIALNNTAPSNANLYDAKAILMGRPMAVVRARISFQPKDCLCLSKAGQACL